MIKFLDCTLRDGGYYNKWDFSEELIADYLQAMSAVAVDYVEIGFRTKLNSGFKGGCGFSTDDYISSLPIPNDLKDKIGVMVNASELVAHSGGLDSALEQLFVPADASPVTLVRIACHVHEFEASLPAARWLKDRGYVVGFNLMQVADRSASEVEALAKLASGFPIDVLYFADSMGGLLPADVDQIVDAIKSGWSGAIGIHTHDNMGNALANTLHSINKGVTWVDSTVTGMGRGPGNAKTEYLAIELKGLRERKSDVTKLFELIRVHFSPLQRKYGWGSNPYYYLAGKYGIHPTYVQEMLGDARYNEEEILSAIDHLRVEGGKKFSLDTLEIARHFYSGKPKGSWNPSNSIAGRDVLVLGSGPGAIRHLGAIEAFIEKEKPYVIALNNQKHVRETLIDARAASHPVRLMADSQEYLALPQPLITPASMLPSDVRESLGGKELLDFGLGIAADGFEVSDSHCTIPTTMVVAYVLAVTMSGKARRIYLAGFDGYNADDPRRGEVDSIFRLYQSIADVAPILSLTPTLYDVPGASVYGFL